MIAMLRNNLVDHFQNFQAGVAGLSQSFAQDVHSYALHLDVHLQSGHAFGSTGNFEVHLAESVFHTLDVGQNNVIVAFFN